VGLLRRTARTRPTRLFFAADIHGSEPTFRKFLGAAKAYDADALVFGGDIMGKALVPIVRENGTYARTSTGSTTSSTGMGSRRSRTASRSPGSTGR
jgi:Icc-related predicted phosphoesterase